MSNMKEKIIYSAYEIFSEKGYVETTVSEISEKTGVAYGTVYFHFQKGKDGVLNSILSLVMEEFFEILDVEYSVKIVRDNKSVMYEQLKESFKIVDNNKRMMQVLWEAKGKSDLIYENVLPLKEKLFCKILENIQSNSEKGFIKSKEKLLTARVFLQMVWGVIWEYAFSEKCTAEEVAETVTKIYAKGVYA